MDEHRTQSNVDDFKFLILLERLKIVTELLQSNDEEDACVIQRFPKGMRNLLHDFLPFLLENKIHCGVIVGKGAQIRFENDGKLKIHLSSRQL